MVYLSMKTTILKSTQAPKNGKNSFCIPKNSFSKSHHKQQKFLS